MAQNDLLKRLLDAGVAFTQMTQKRAEEIVGELVRTGEMRAEQAQTMVQELVDRSRQNTERIVDSVRDDIRAQLPPDLVWLIDYLFTTVLDGRNESMTHGIQEALNRPPRDFSEYARRTAASCVWNRPAEVAR